MADSQDVLMPVLCWLVMGPGGPRVVTDVREARGLIAAGELVRAYTPYDPGRALAKVIAPGMVSAEVDPPAPARFSELPGTEPRSKTVRFF